MQNIRLNNCFQLKGTLEALRNHWELLTLDLNGCSSLEGTLSPLQTLSSLQSLNLSHCQFTGSLEPLQSLKSLITLDLSYSANLQGTLEPLRGLNSLRRVDIRGCWGLSGGIPPPGETAVNSFRVPTLRNWQEWRKDDIGQGIFHLIPQDCKALEEITEKINSNFWKLASENYLFREEFSPWERSWVPRLEIRKNRVVGLRLERLYGLKDLWPISKLTALETLDLSSCEIGGTLDPLQELTSLRFLNLSGDLMTDLYPLSGLKNLEFLSLKYCDWLSGDLEPLRGLTSLKSLNLSDCEWLKGTLEPLSGLTSLRFLGLSFCTDLKGTLEPLSNLKSLEILLLSHNFKLEGDLEALTGLKRLRNISIESCGGLSEEPEIFPIPDPELDLKLNTQLPDEAIKKIWEQLIDMGVDKDNESDVFEKVLSLGFDGMGADHLVRILTDYRFRVLGAV